MQCSFDLSRMMRIVVNDRDSGNLTLLLETAVCSYEREQSFCHSVSGKSEQITGCNCRCCICDIVLARNGELKRSENVIVLFQSKSSVTEFGK